MRKSWIMMGLVLMMGCPAKKERSEEACTSRFVIDATQPSYLLNQEDGVVKWYINFDWFPMDGIETDLVARKIFTDTHTQIQFMKGSDDRLNQMIASGQMPDLVTVEYNTNFVKSADRWAIPLNVLADCYDPYFYEVAKADSLDWYRDEHGNVYGYPSYTNDYDDFLGEDSVMIGREGFLVREDIYQAIGSPNMQDPRGFLQALRDAKSYDPTITPLSIRSLQLGGGAAGITLMNFLAVPIVKNNQYYERLLDEDYLIWIETLRQAYQEGLISDDNFSDTDDMYLEKMGQGQYFATLTTLKGLSQPIVQNIKRNVNQKYIAIDGPANRKGDAPTMEQPGIGGWTMTFITKDAQDKERAMQLLTYMMTKEGRLTTNLGVEGETYYQGDDGRYYFTPETIAFRADDIDKFLKEVRLGEYWMLGDENFDLRYTDSLIPEMKQIYAWTHGKQVPQFVLEDTDPEPRSAEAKVWTVYQQERGDVVTRMIRATSHEALLAELEMFQKRTRDMGIEEALAIKNAKIAQNIERLTAMGYIR